MSGRGSFFWRSTGSSFEGNFLNNKKDGEGIFRWQDGKVFFGKWLKDQKENEGELIYPHGGKLFGVWHEDSLNGEAVYITSQGLLQKLSYFNGQRV